MWLSGEEPVGPAKAGATGCTCSVPGRGRSPGGGNGNTLQCSWLENLRERGVWRAKSTGLQRVGYDWSDLADRQAGGLNRNLYFSQFWRSKSATWCQQWLASGESSLLCCRLPASVVASHPSQGRELCTYKGSSLLSPQLYPNLPKASHLLMPSQWGLGFKMQM